MTVCPVGEKEIQRDTSHLKSLKPLTVLSILPPNSYLDILVGERGEGARSFLNPETGSLAEDRDDREDREAIFNL